MADSVNLISLCAGYGGLYLAFDIATGGQARTVCYVEREAACAAILAASMEQGCLAPAPIWSDLRTFDGRRWRGVVDCIIGGYPCQPFSFAGRRLGAADERHLWPDIARIVEEVEPCICGFENVAGHLGLGFDVVRADLRRMGYRVTAGLFTAAEVGAPHKRERLFILAVADSDGCGRRTQGNTSIAPVGFDWGGVQLADSENVGHERQRTTREWRHGPENVCDGALGIFPPGPGDREQWERILAVRPDLAPATQPGVCGVDDGSASRLDRLRALGNGVVPLEGAYAFATLFSCLR